MAKSITASSLFTAQAMMTRDQPFRNVTDSENAARIAMQQRVQGGAKSPHPKPDGNGLPVKRVKK